MASNETKTRLDELESAFRRERADRGGRPGGRYPDALWQEVARLSRAGVSNRDLCERCGISNGTLSQALGRTLARGVERSKRASSHSKAFKTLCVEALPAMEQGRFDVVFPNGVCLRLPPAALDEALLARLKSC